MSSAEYEKVFYLYLLKNPDLFRVITKDFFETREVGALYDLSKKFFERYQEIPSEEQLSLIAKKDPRYKKDLEGDVIKIIFSEPYDSYDEDWIEETSQSWILWKNFELSLVDTLQYAKSVKVTSDNIQDVINKSKAIINDRNNINFSNELGSNFFDESSHKIENEDKITSNHNFVDQLTSGGYFTKSLVVYAGPSNVGKSIWLANDAANYVKSGYNTAVITAEMPEKQYIHRIGSNMLNIPINEYEKIASNSKTIKNKLDNITKGVNPPGKLFVKQVPTSQASVLDIEAYLKEQELVSGIKFRVVIVDYINILANYRNPNTESTYIKIKQISEDLRAMGIKNNWLVISATQVNRSGMDASDFSLTSISESSGLGFTADVVYGIIQDNSMYLENIYWLKIIKNRSGAKLQKCKYNIMYDYMRLQETTEVISSTGEF